MHVGIIGCGNVATGLIGLLPKVPATRVTVLVRPGTEGKARDRVATRPDDFPVSVVSSLDAFLGAAPDVAVECAGHQAVAAYGAAILEHHIDLIVVSVGAMADEGLRDRLTRAATEPTAGRIIYPIGAIGGIDLLSMLALAGAPSVTYTGTKPPAAWKGSPAEATVDLDTLTERAVFFKGTAREAAVQYPKNANVVAALALAGAGFDKTRVELVADPSAASNTHAYQVASPLCDYGMEIAAQPSPDNPRTSATTAWSVLSELRRLAAEKAS